MTIGLVLAGGGIRGVAHLGVLKAMEETGIKPSMISGTSAGALVGALYGSGLDPQTILDEIEGLNVLKLVRPAFTSGGMLSMEKIRTFVEKFIGDRTFDSLHTPLIVAATDLRKGKITYFRKGPLLEPLLCSSCIPVVFQPYVYKGKTYVDGGILDNFPLKPLKKKVDSIIGSYCNYVASDFTKKGFKSMVERSLLLAINNDMISKRKQCDVLISPPGLADVSVFDFRHTQDIFDMGYKEALVQLQELVPS